MRKKLEVNAPYAAQIRSPKLGTKEKLVFLGITSDICIHNYQIPINKQLM